MFNINKTLISLSVIGLFALAGSAEADITDASAIESEVNQCVAEVRERVDMSEATRVRHDVVSLERRSVGYEMKISTSVYGQADGDVIRAYAASCIISGNNKPLKFSISEIS